MAIYQSKFLQPYNTTIDATAINPFSFTCQGSTITKYNAKVYRVSDNVQVYTTGDITLSPAKYNNDVATFNLPSSTLVNGVQYKWSVTTYEGANFATSFQVTFWANATATLAMTIPPTITSQRYTFTATYAQSDNVSIQYFYFVLSDNTGELERTNLIFSGNVSYTFDGFVNGNNYSIQVFGLTANEATVQSTIYNFGVSYLQPNLVLKPTITQDYNTSLVAIQWDNIIQINGTSTGNISYISGLALDGGKALSLDVNATANWNVSIPEDFTCQFLIRIPDPTNAIKLEIKNGYYFGYESGKFYTDISGVRTYTFNYSTVGKKYFVSLLPTRMVIKEIIG